jgi:hypothetical protein
MMEYDIHTVLDFLTLVATVWVIYELRFPLADTYQKDQDTIQAYYVVRCDVRAPVWPLGCTVVRLCVLCPTALSAVVQCHVLRRVLLRLPARLVCSSQTCTGVCQ